ncbi:MAG: hypothetical protein LBS61_00625 [Endomicrobium sp.]|nr:hypothetical protein [Endomicrobium sp.]
MATERLVKRSKEFQDFFKKASDNGVVLDFSNIIRMRQLNRGKRFEELII